MITVDFESLGAVLTLLVGFSGLGIAMLASHRNLKVSLDALAATVTANRQEATKNHHEALAATNRVRTELSAKIDDKHEKALAATTELAGTVAANQEKALAATEKTRDELRKEITDVRHRVDALADRLFDETPRSRSAHG